MKTTKKIIGENLSLLRKEKGLTQLEVANKFAYSDKAVSKWENGDTLPDIDVLLEICEYYGVTLDFLTHEGSYEDKSQFVIDSRSKTNSILITFLVISIVWILATIVFVWLYLFNNVNYYIIFIWAVSGSCLVSLMMAKLFNRKKFYLVVFSVFVWSIIVGIYLQFLSYNIWPIFFLGIPSEIAIVLWSNIKPKNKTISKRKKR